MAFNTSDPTYQDLLARVLESGAQVVPFVGAGLSAYGDPEQRLPLWRDLLRRLIAEGEQLGLIDEGGDTEIEEAFRSERYIEATDRILDALGEPTFRRVVERELDDSGKPTPPATAELVAIGWSLIVTTNLDRLIGRAYLERYGRPMNRIDSLDTHKLAAALAGTLVSQETALAQIHGDIDTYRSWRLTRSHYEQLLQDPGYVEALKHLFLRRVFFVGFGLQDDDFDFLLDTIARIYPAGVGEFYALIASSHRHHSTVLRLIKQNGLRPIFYDVDPDGDATPFGKHRAVFECLKHLATTWATTRTGFDFTMKYFPELDPNVVGRDREVARLAELVAGKGCVAQVVGLGGLGKTSLLQQFLVERRPQIAEAGYRGVFGCSFYRADIGQFIQDLALATVGPEPLPLPLQVDRICEHVRRHRTLLILDGVEAVLNVENQLRGPYVPRIVESVVRGQGSVVTTSRVRARGGMFEHAPIIEVDPLSPEQILVFLRRWGLDHLGDAANRRLIEITAGHPLALRILAGVLRDVPGQDAITTIERSAVIDVSDEVDPLRENRLARIFGSYVHHLDDAEIALLVCLTAFEGPTSYPLVEAALTREYPDTSVNGPLLGRDLRPIVGGLLERRLLTASTTGELSCHPTVREYFARHAHQAGGSLVPIHRYLAAESLRFAEALPSTFEEASPVIAACRHAAACGDWTLFDDLFRRRLMRGFRDYFCESLGAWEEALGLARLGEHPSFPAASTPRPGYYPITVARCLKHLGRSSESREKYLESLRGIASSKSPDTAMYVNNFLTLLIWRGELADADRLVELNIRALSWIGESWRHRWQIEHSFSSIGYLKMLQGQLETASVLFDHSERAWDGFPGERPWIYDYYPFYRSELVLLNDPNAHDDALTGIETLLAVADAHDWPESICRGHIQAALVHLDRASRVGDPAELTRAIQRLDRAGGIGAGMNVADVAIAYHLTRLKAELVQREVYAEAHLDTASLEGSVERLEVLIETSGLGLATPEVAAARGVLAYFEGATERAAAAHELAARECRRQGNALTPSSPRSLVNWLGRRVDREATFDPTGSKVDVIGLVGSELQPDWMMGRLDELSPRR